MGFVFFVKSVLLGVGLAMDAFSVSLANGLNDSKMKTKRVVLISFIFALFQFLMPLIGWLCVHTIANEFKIFEKCIPYIALVLLVFIGGKMLLDCKNEECSECGNTINCKEVGILALIIQGIATSIDALSVGFTISDYTLYMAFISCLVIALVTFLICFTGVLMGKKFGTSLSGKASLLGGIILIIIGIEIFVTGVF